MKSLLDISADLQAIADLIDETGGELTPESEAALDQWFAEASADRDRKLDGYAALIRELTLRAAARKEEQERLAIRVRVDEATVRGLKDRLVLFFASQGLRKIETARYKLALVQNGGLAPLEVLVPVDQLDDAYVKVRREVDVDALRKAIADGIEVPARLKPRGSHIRIS